MDNIDNKKANKKKEWNITVSADNWTDTTPYSQTIAVEGLTVEDEPNIYLIKSIEPETRKTEQEAFNKISDARTAENSITIYCDEEKPDITFNLALEVVY